jgi:hypothetical protein
MAYQLVYDFRVRWIGPGQPTIEGGGSGQTVKFPNAAGGQCSQTFTGTDITNLTNAAAADMVTQLTAAQAQIQAWAKGALGANQDGGGGGQ